MQFLLQDENKKSMLYSLVLPCLGLMQPCAAGEYLTSPLIDDAHDQLTLKSPN
jgi:hypothetical protein